MFASVRSNQLAPSKGIADRDLSLSAFWVRRLPFLPRFLERQFAAFSCPIKGMPFAYSGIVLIAFNIFFPSGFWVGIALGLHIRAVTSLMTAGVSGIVVAGLYWLITEGACFHVGHGSRCPT